MRIPNNLDSFHFLIFSLNQYTYWNQTPCRILIVAGKQFIFSRNKLLNIFFILFIVRSSEQTLYLC